MIIDQLNERIIDDAIFCGSSLNGYSFHRYSLSKIGVCAKRISKCDFRNSTMERLYINETKITRSILIMLNVIDSNIIKCDLSKEYIAFSHFTNVDFTNTSFKDTTIKNNIFKKCKFFGSDMRFKEVSDCTFEDCICDMNTHWNKEHEKSTLGVKQIGSITKKEEI